LKVQVEYAGRLEQAKLTVPAYPPTGEIVKVALPEFPAVIVKLVGFALTL
jgi:hypothetical protein